MKDKILVFIPAYNCEKQITRVLAQIDDEVRKYISEIIIVNNVSTDNTVEAAQKYLEEHPLPCKIITNDNNYNLGGSHKVAFNYAIENDFDHLIVLHGDDQANIHDFLPVLKKKIYRKHDCILGSRFVKGSRLIGYSKKRIFGNLGLNFVFTLLLGRKISDLGSGLNMYRTDIFRNRYFHKFPDALYFNAVMLMASCYYKHDMRFYPITWREQDQVSNAKLFGLSFSILKLLFRYFINKKKLVNSEFREKKIKKYTYKIVAEYKD